MNKSRLHLNTMDQENSRIEDSFESSSWSCDVLVESLDVYNAIHLSGLYIQNQESIPLIVKKTPIE